MPKLKKCDILSNFQFFRGLFLGPEYLSDATPIQVTLETSIWQWYRKEKVCKLHDSFKKLEKIWQITVGECL